MLEKEGGLDLLRKLCCVTQSDTLYRRVLYLAHQIIARCDKVRDNVNYRSDDELEDSVVVEPMLQEDDDAVSDDNDEFVDDFDDNY